MGGMGEWMKGAKVFEGKIAGFRIDDDDLLNVWQLKQSLMWNCRNTIYGNVFYYYYFWFKQFRKWTIDVGLPRTLTYLCEISLMDEMKKFSFLEIKTIQINLNDFKLKLLTWTFVWLMISKVLFFCTKKVFHAI